MEHDDSSRISLRRRGVLAGLAGSLALAGCVGDDDNGDDDNGDENGEEENGLTNGADVSWPPVKGNPEAAVTIEVYTDFGCPACGIYADEYLPDIEEEYLQNGQVRYEHRDLVLPVYDPESYAAANAARAVFHEEGHETFWEYKSALLERQGELQTGPDVLGDIADEMGLDGEAIQSAGETEQYEDEVQADYDRAIQHGVPGTPTPVVEGEVASGETLDEIVENATVLLDDALANGTASDSGDETDTAGGGGY